jgi:hypothetical protein
MEIVLGFDQASWRNPLSGACYHSKRFALPGLLLLNPQNREAAAFAEDVY